MNYNKTTKTTKTTLTDILDNFFYYHEISSEDLDGLTSELLAAQDADYHKRATNQTDEWYQISDLLILIMKIQNKMSEQSRSKK